MKTQNAEMLKSIMIGKDNSDQIEDALRLQIYDEIKKPDSQMNSASINDSLNALDDIHGVSQDNVQIRKDKDELLSLIKSRYKKRAGVISKVVKVSVAMVSTLCIIFISVISSSASHISIQSWIHNVFSFGDSSTSKMVQNDSLYAYLKSKSESYGMEAVFPAVFPEKINPAATKYSSQIHYSILAYTLKSKYYSIQYTIRQFSSETDMTKIKISDDDMNVLNIGGRKYVITKNGRMYTIVFNDGLYSYTIQTNMPYQAINKMIASIKWS